MTATDPVSALRAAVQTLADALPALTEGCTDPEARDLAMLLHDVRTAREALHALERGLETQTAQAMTSDQALAEGLRVDRSRATARREWDHESWQRDARRQVLRSRGLLGVTLVSADGEPLDLSLSDVLADVQAVHGATAPKSTALRGLGLDVRDYCQSTPGAWRVAVHVENTTNESEAA